MRSSLQKENDLLLENNKKLTTQLGHMTEKLHDGAQKLLSMNFSLAEQKVLFSKEADKKQQTIEMLNQKIEQLQKENFKHQEDNQRRLNDVPISADVVVEKESENYRKVNEQLKEQVAKLIEELESKLPTLQDLETSNKDLKESLVSNVFKLEEVSVENKKLKESNWNLSEKLKQSSKSINILQTKCKDLSSQVQNLLAKDQDKPVSSNRFDHKISNSQHVISSVLVNFNNIEELQTQNIKLLTSIRELTAKFEDNKQSNSRYTPAMQMLQDEIDTLKARLEVLTTENSSYKTLVVGNKLIEQQKENEATIEDLNGQLESNLVFNKKAVAELDENLNKKDTEITTLNDTLLYISKEKEDLATELKIIQKMNDNLRDGILKEQEQNNKWEREYIEEKESAQYARSEYKDLENQLDKVSFQLRRWELDGHEVVKMLDEHENKNRDLERQNCELKSQIQEPASANGDYSSKIKEELLQQSRLYDNKINELMQNLSNKEKTFEKNLAKANKEIGWLQEQLDKKEKNIKDDDDIVILFEHVIEKTGVNVSTTLPSNNQVDENIQNDKSYFQNESASLQIEVNLLKRQLEILEKKYNIDLTTFNSSVTEVINDDEISKNYKSVMNEISGLNILKEKLASLGAELQKTLNEKAALTTEKQTLQKTHEATLSELESCKNNLQAIKNNFDAYKKELSKWKNTANELSSKNPKEIEALSNKVEQLNATLQNKINENKELEDRFSRLKKQAHEKLDASKTTSAQLAVEVNDLTNKQAELEIVIARYKEMQHEYESKKEEFSKMQKELNSKDEELKSLQAKLEETTSKNEVEEKIKALKEKYEQKEKELIEKITSEIKSKYENSDNTSAADIDKMREEWENETLARIEEAKENLKKHIRLPSEEKINKVIDKRKTELENEFDQRVSEKANALKLSDELNKPAEEIAKDLEQKIKDRIEEEFNNTLKKKSFEEGKHQASMRTTLLERKITKLEAQLEGTTTPDNNSSISEQPKSSSGLSKINIDNPFNQSKLKPENKTFSTLSNGESSFNQQDKVKNPFSSANSPLKDGNDSSGSITVKKPFMFNSEPKSTVASFSLPKILPHASMKSPFTFGQKFEETNSETNGKRKSEDSSASEDIDNKKLKSNE